MQFRLFVHTLTLGLLNVFAIRIGIQLDTWAHVHHPFVAQIPAAAIISIVGFTCWYHGANTLSNGKWRLNDWPDWRNLYKFAFFVGALLFVGYYRFLLTPFSTGRLVTFCLFEALVNAAAIAILFPQRYFQGSIAIRQLLRKRWFLRLACVAGSAFVAVALLASVELGFYLINRSLPLGPQKTYVGGYLEPGEFFDWDQDLGRKLVSNAVVDCKLTVDDVQVWDVSYSTDQFGRRTTVNPNTTARNEYAVFFGCSFLFGEGAEDFQTIPSEFAAASPSHRAYNYGVPGYGTQQMLAKLESGIIADEIQEHAGIVIYLYLEDVHEPRVVGDMQLTNSFAADFPYYDMDRDGKLKRFGNFKTGRPITSSIYSLFGHSEFVRYARINFPKPHEDHYRLTASIIEASRDLCLSELGCERFYVVNYPGHGGMRRIKPYLLNAKINVLDCSTLFNPSEPGFFHPGDGHPTPKANRLLAQAIASKLNDVQHPPNETSE